MNLVPYVIGWATLGVVVLGLALFRRSVASKEDGTLHVSKAEAALVSEQQAIAKRLGKIDLWGEILTVIVVLWGLGMAAYYLYHMWEQSGRITQ